MANIQERALKNPKAFITDFFRRCGIGQAINMQQFFKRIRRNNLAMTERFFEIMDTRADGDQIDIYPVKNHSLEFANSIISQFDSARLRELGIWLIQENLKPKRILEIGCDSGLFSCFLAYLYPGSVVVGIDSCSEGIELAHKRATKLGLKNVEFEKADLNLFSKQYNGQPFDIMLACIVFHEIIEQLPGSHSQQLTDQNPTHFSIAEFDCWVKDQLRPSKQITETVRHLATEGRFISVDRWQTCERLLSWIRLAELSGLSCNLNKSTFIRYKDEGTQNKSENLPLTVFYPGIGVHPGAEEVLSLCGHKEFINLFTKKVFDCEIAEMIYCSFDPKEIVVTIRAVYHDKSGILLMQLGGAKAIGFLYQTTSGGFRELRLLPICCLLELIPRIEEIRKEFSAHAEVTIDWNSSSSLLHRLGNNEGFVNC